FLVAISLCWSHEIFAQRAWTNSQKKGVAYSLAPSNQAMNLPFIHEMNTDWLYTWGPEPLSGFDSLPMGIDFVPMAWGRAGLVDPAPNRIDLWISGQQAGLYDTLLGFNEPDLTSQSNMSVDEAIELWPLLESTGLRLGSPAVASFNSDWFSDFMASAESEKLRVDFVALHRYPGPNADGFISFLEQVYQTYQKPIWITEFAVRDGDAITPEDNRWTDDQVFEFMAEVLPALEAMDFVERYSWFPATRNNPFLTSSAMHEPDGLLTRVGRLYKGTVKFLNPSFEAAGTDTDQARDWTQFNSVTLESVFARNGGRSLKMAPSLDIGQSLPGIARQEFIPEKDFDLGQSYSIGAWVYHSSSQPITGTRELTFRFQWFDQNDNLIADSRKVVADSTTPTDQWNLVKFEDVEIPDDSNIAKVRVAIFANNVGNASVNSGYFYVDDVALNAGPTVVVEGIIGDVNQDGQVDLLDISPLISLLSAGNFQLEADVNEDGLVNLLDVDPFVELLNGNRNP
ncbi:MAG: glycosyl hydrolase, partial [Planctomycetota bacterium]